MFLQWPTRRQGGAFTGRLRSSPELEDGVAATSSTRTAALIVLLLASGAWTSGLASSEDAWKEFHESVERACLEASAATLADARAWVAPYGTTSHGVAVVTGRSTESSEQRFIVCVYDKQTSRTELTASERLSRLLETE